MGFGGRKLASPLQLQVDDWVRPFFAGVPTNGKHGFAEYKPDTPLEKFVEDSLHFEVGISFEVGSREAMGYKLATLFTKPVEDLLCFDKDPSSKGSGPKVGAFSVL